MRNRSFSLALLLLALSSLLAFADDVNIDCGSSSTYLDGNDLQWVGDGDYTQSGKAMTVSNPLSDHVIDTLQVFSTGNTNCYSVPTVPHQQVLVRATFFYGNYDNKSSPPTFDLLLDTNPWDTVVTSTNRTMRYEAIYVVKGSTINICVAKTSNNHIPFMSALEIRSMTTDMYKYFHPDTALFLLTRTFFSDTVSSILDSSGRIWDSIDVPSNMMMERSESTLIMGSTAADNPPEEVLQHAATVAATSPHIQITISSLPTTNVPVYVNMYFSEVTLLDPTTQQRLFNIYVDDQLITEEPIAPPYGSVYEYTMYNFTANSSTSFSVVAATESTLPPLINAFEVFTVSDVLVQTNGDDGATTTPSDTPGSDETTTSSRSKKNPSNKKKKKSNLAAILGPTISIGVAFFAILGILVRRHQKRKSAAIAATSNLGQAEGPIEEAPIIGETKV